MKIYKFWTEPELCAYTQFTGQVHLKCVLLYLPIVLNVRFFFLHCLHRGFCFENGNWSLTIKTFLIN